MIERYSGTRIRPYEDKLWVRDDVLLESALSAPSATFGGAFLYKSVAAMAGAYWHSLNMNHPFEDGNKRVALAATSVFLRMNGLRLTLGQVEAEEITLQMAAGNISRDQVLELVEANVELIDPTPLGLDPV